MTKYGFYFNQDDCIGCKTCQLACKDKNDLPIGLLFRRVRDFEVGSYPDATLYHYAQTCNHCANPACVAVCPVGAMYIDEAEGVVLHNDATCIGCQMCVKNCPYGVPVYDAELGIARKCDSCKQLRENGEQPACVAACQMRALEFGPYEELAAAHPNAVFDIAILPDSSETSPCTLIDPKAAALEEGAREVYL